MSSIGTIPTQQKTIEAYKLYSLFYAPISLLAYWIVWRGNIFKHIKFFREVVKPNDTQVELLDLATGDGSLTRAALLKRKSIIRRLVCVDLSRDMLSKAQKKLKMLTVEFLNADVEKLPFADATWGTVTCFGGFNSFANPGAAMREIHRVMKPGAVLRGSALLLPATHWRQKIIAHWIHQGYQSTKITREVFHEWVSTSGFSGATYYQYGDVLLFECIK